MTEPKDLPAGVPEMPKGGQPMGKQAMFNKISSRGAYLIEELFKDVESRNPSVRIAALRTLLNKVLPDLKAQELTGEGGMALRVIIEDYGTTNKPPTETA